MSKLPSESKAQVPDQESTAIGSKYKGFGSFHSDNVEVLIAQSDAEYVAPTGALSAKLELTTPFPFGKGAQVLILLNDGIDGTFMFINHGACGISRIIKRFLRRLISEDNIRGAELELTTPFPFGKGAQKYFLLNEDTEHPFTFINHGAFGASLKHAVALKHSYERLMEAQPLTFVDRTLLPLLVHATRRLAAFVNAKPTNVAPLPNATFGLNSAINSLVRSGDVVGFLDTRYGSVNKMLRARAEDVGASLHEIPVQRLIAEDVDVLASDDRLTAYIEERLPTGCSVFVVDHITSNAAFAFPVFTHLVPMLRKNGVRHIIVDGAHGPLQCELDFTSHEHPERLPTVYVGNLHKWVSAPKSVGFLWVEDAARDSIRAPIVSHGFGAGFLSQFVWCGTTDYGAALSVPSVLDFWESVGAAEVRRHCTETMRSVKGMLESAFKVDAVARHAPFLALVKLPEELQPAGKEITSKLLQDLLHHRFRIEVPVKEIAGSFYVRISVMVYNRVEEYETLRDAILVLATEISNGNLKIPSQ